MGIDDGLFLAGALLIGAGVWWIYPPAALIFAGAVCWAGSFFLGWIGRGEDETSDGGGD